MNELILEALRLLLAAELRRDVTQAAGARALVDRIDAMLGVMRQDRGVSDAGVAGNDSLRPET